VRRLKYFYGNTLLDGSSFDFHGSPLAMLRGRLIGIVLLIGYSQAAKISLTLWLCVLALIASGMPWLLWKSLQFRLGNSSYRGIRFGFDGGLAAAYATFGLPILFLALPYVFVAMMGLRIKPGQPPEPMLAAYMGLSFLLLLALGPWFYLRVKRFQHGNARLGSTPFRFSGTLGGAYGLAFATLGLLILAALLGTVLGIAGGYLAHSIAHASGSLLGAGKPGTSTMSANADTMVSTVTGVAIGYAVLLCVYPILAAMRQNFVWSRTSLGDAPFRSEVAGLTLLRLWAVNLFFIIVTLGLYWPYAVIRAMRYQVGAISWAGDPASVVAHAAQASATAIGEETAELFGFDLAL
jgi:uncharacterized membrane protein YjgN (DUF898 family)